MKELWYNKDMSKSKKYIMWSDGVLASFGEQVEKLDNGSFLVRNPATVMFQVVNEPVFELDENSNVKIDEFGQPIVKRDDKGQPIMKGGLKWEMNPYVFGACLKDSGDNIWTINASNIINEDAEYDERLIGHYTTLVKLCDKTQG